MAKGQQKKTREDKKPKKAKSGDGAPKSAYAQSMSGKSTATTFTPKK